MEVGGVVEDAEGEVGVGGAADEGSEAGGREARGPGADGRGDGVGGEEIGVGGNGGQMVKIDCGGEVGEVDDGGKRAEVKVQHRRWSEHGWGL